MKTRKRGGGKGDAKPPEKKHVKKNPVSKPPISEPPISDPPIKSILRESKYADRNYFPPKDERQITVVSNGKLPERLPGFKKKITHLESKPDKIVESAVKTLSEDERMEQEKKQKLEEAQDHAEIIIKLLNQGALQAVMSQIQKEFKRDITEEDLRAIVSQSCRESTRGEPVEIGGWTFDQQNQIMDIIDNYEVTTNTAQKDVSDAPSRCNIMGGKRKAKRKTRKRRKTRRKKTKRRRNLS